MTQNKEILNWLRANNIYHNWVSKTKLREFFSKNIKFEGLSLWWITRLVDKDNVIENSWHNDFKKIVDGKKIKNHNFFWILFISKLIKNFFKNLFNLLYYKSFALIFSKKIRPGQYENCFHSIDYNFQNYKREFSDRLYGLAPSKNKKKIFI